jgi:hypothetical protein
LNNYYNKKKEMKRGKYKRIVKENKNIKEIAYIYDLSLFDGYF